MITEIKNDLLTFLSTSFYNENWEQVVGQNKFNEGLETSEQIHTFSLGNFKTLPSDFILVQANNANGNRSILPALGLEGMAYNVNMLLELEKSANPSNACALSDKYFDLLIALLEEWLYTSSGIYVNPQLTISKGYNDEGINNYSQINKIKISVGIVFDYRKGVEL